MDQIVSLSVLVGWALRIYSWVHIAAFIMSWISADPNNQIVYWINRLTLPMWNWVRFRLPNDFSAFAPIIALLLVIYAQISIPGIIRTTGALAFEGLGFGDFLFNSALWLVFGGLSILASIIGFVMLLAIIWFVFGLVNPTYTNPIVRAIWFLIDPLLTPIQRYMPRSKIDFSPLVLALIAFLLRSLTYRLMIPVDEAFLIK